MIGGYTVEWLPAADRDLSKLEAQVQARVLRKVEELAGNPRPHNVVKLSGSEDLYRVRVGRHRVIYEIADDVLLVTVVKVALREEKTYRGL